MSWNAVSNETTLFADATSSGVTTLTFTSLGESFATFNLNRFIDADPLVTSGSGNNADEIDFNNTFSTENPWVFTASTSSIAFTSGRNDPV